MRWRLLPTILLATSLLGCTADERQTELCRRIVATVAGDATDLAALPAERDGAVRFGFAAADELSRHRPALHEMTCRFAGGAYSTGRLELMAVEEDGKPLSDIRMILLRHLLGLPTPGALLAPPAPDLPLAAHAAYFVQQLINGLSLGAIFALVAVGYALIYGMHYRWLPRIRHGHFVLFDGGGFAVYLAESQIAILVLAILSTALLGYLMMHTEWGRAHRACADDPKMAGLLGVDIWGTLNRSFTVGAVLAALAGTAFTLQYGEADFFMGYFMGFKALTAALLGGFGTVTGALVGGLLLGLFEAFWAGYFSSAYKDVAVFGVLALVLIFRPNGLLGRNLASTNAFPVEANFAARER